MTVEAAVFPGKTDMAYIGSVAAAAFPGSRTWTGKAYAGPVAFRQMTQNFQNFQIVGTVAHLVKLRKSETAGSRTAGKIDVA